MLELSRFDGGAVSSELSLVSTSGVLVIVVSSDDSSDSSVSESISLASGLVSGYRANSSIGLESIHPVQWISGMPRDIRCAWNDELIY